MYRRLKKIGATRAKEEKQERQASVTAKDVANLDVSKDSKDEQSHQLTVLKTDQRSINQSTKKQPQPEVLPLPQLNVTQESSKESSKVRTDIQ